MKQKSIDILIVMGIAIVAVALTFIVPPENVVLRILTLPLVLILPGYALTSALFYRIGFDGIERLVLSLGLSLVIGILGGLALNLTSFGLHAGTWAIFLGTITLVSCTVELVRRSFEAKVLFSAPIDRPPGSSGIRGICLTLWQGLLFGLAALIVCVAVVMSTIGAEQQPHPGFTQLWILPASGALSKSSVLVGVRNMEKMAMQYRLDVNEDGKIIELWASIGLQPGENWEVTLALLQAQQTGKSRVEAMLYRADTPRIMYRHVVLWLDT